jgi:hypothetical protein
VPGELREAEDARQVLKKAKIRIDDPIDGICLPRNTSTPNPEGTLVHETMHTLEYCIYINRLLSKAYESGHSQEGRHSGAGSAQDQHLRGERSCARRGAD